MFWADTPVSQLPPSPQAAGRGPLGSQGMALSQEGTNLELTAGTGKEGTGGLGRGRWNTTPGGHQGLYLWF